MKATSAPIGVFDSGVGGLTVARAIKEFMPNERLIYFGDTIHLPYGDKTPATIRQYSREITRFLIREEAKAVVVACNSASAAAFDALKQEFGQKVILLNVIDPVVVEIGQHPEWHTIGVLGTRATVNSGIYPREIHERAPAVQVLSKATPLFVPIIEEGLAKSGILRELILHYFTDPDWAHPDALILGCTHYPLIELPLQNHFGKSTHVLNTPKIVAKALEKSLKDQQLLATSLPINPDVFYLSEHTETFVRTAREFFGEDVMLEERNIWEHL